MRDFTQIYARSYFFRADGILCEKNAFDDKRRLQQITFSFQLFVQKLFDQFKSIKCDNVKRRLELV